MSERQIIRDVLDSANQMLGENIIQQDEWDRHGEWNEQLGRHEQYVVPRKDIWFKERCLKAGEKIFVVASHQDDQRDREELWKGAYLQVIGGWQVLETDYDCIFCPHEVQAPSEERVMQRQTHSLTEA